MYENMGTSGGHFATSTAAPAPEVHEPNFLKVVEGVDISRVMAELEAAPHLWNEHSVRKEYAGTPHSRMSDIWVRYNAFENFKGDLNAFNEEHIPVWYPAWYQLPSLHPIVHGLMTIAEGEMIGGVLITRVPPGEKILPHADKSWHVNYFSKFYLSLQSAPGSVFGCKHRGHTETIEPKTGECWLFDNRKVHWVENNSDRDRITCIICIRTENPRYAQ